jgi:hypothetical protein
MKGTQSRDKCDVITIEAKSAAREVGGIIRGKRISLVLSGSNVDGRIFSRVLGNGPQKPGDAQ